MDKNKIFNNELFNDVINNEDLYYENKYLKYKTKYTELKIDLEGGTKSKKKLINGFSSEYINKVNKDKYTVMCFYKMKNKESPELTYIGSKEIGTIIQTWESINVKYNVSYPINYIINYKILKAISLFNGNKYFIPKFNEINLDFNLSKFKFRLRIIKRCIFINYTIYFIILRKPSPEANEKYLIYYVNYKRDPKLLQPRITETPDSCDIYAINEFNIKDYDSYKTNFKKYIDDNFESNLRNVRFKPFNEEFMYW